MLSESQAIFTMLGIDVDVVDGDLEIKLPFFVFNKDGEAEISYGTYPYTVNSGFFEN